MHYWHKSTFVTLTPTCTLPIPATTRPFLRLSSFSVTRSATSITRVAELSDRLSVEVIGYTHERRPILFVVATSPENRARLDTIRTRHRALTEAGNDQPISDDMPGITWINYGVHGAEASGMDASLPFVYHLAAVHGAEASGMDASLPFVYHLAAARGEKIERILSDSVVLVTAIFNPDGHSQRVAWFDAYGSKRRIGDPAHIEHAHIEHQHNWQFARTNHYWFDLNRQWLLLTQLLVRPEPAMVAFDAAGTAGLDAQVA
jgi:hypothetical protein